MTQSTPLDQRAAEVASTAWIAALHTNGPAHLAARSRLHELLLHAARFEMTRRQATLPELREEKLEALASGAAADSLLTTLAKLDDFRGHSRFTTWASKYALREARKAAATAGANRTDQPEGHLHG